MREVLTAKSLARRLKLCGVRVVGVVPEGEVVGQPGIVLLRGGCHVEILTEADGEVWLVVYQWVEDDAAHWVLSCERSVASLTAYILNRMA